jgi:hypothetical protein
LKTTLSWNDQFVELTSKLNKACYSIRLTKPFVPGCAEKDLLFICALSYVVWCYFWGYHSTNMFKIQKRVIRNITNIGRRDSCRQLFKQLLILTLPSQYIFSLLLFVNKNREMFLSNSEIHDINTRFNCSLHLPLPI